MTHPDPPQPDPKDRPSGDNPPHDAAGQQHNPWQSGQPSAPGGSASEPDDATQIRPAASGDWQTESGSGSQQDQSGGWQGGQWNPPQDEQPAWQPQSAPQEPADQHRSGPASSEQPQPGNQWQTDRPTADPYQGQQNQGQQQWQSAQQPDPYNPQGTSAGFGQGQHDPYNPQGQPSAGYPQGQSSAGYPQGQSSAGYPQGQSSAGYAPGQPAAGYPQGQPGGQAYPGWEHQQLAPQKREKFSDANPLKAAFDFSFNSYATPGLVKIIYILAVVIAAVWWIGGTISTFVLGAAASSFGSATGGGGSSGIVLGILSLVLGWIPALLWVLFVRVILEAAMALVRVAEDARGIREKVEK